MKDIFCGFLYMDAGVKNYDVFQELNFLIRFCRSC